MKILVALDGSKFSEAVIEPAAKLAREAQAEVVLAQVVEPHDIHSTRVTSREMHDVVEDEYAVSDMHSGRHGDNLMGSRVIDVPETLETSGQALDRVQTGAEDYLHQISLRFHPVHPEVRVLVGDDVEEELAAIARENQIDLIAMASHGRTGLGRLVLGSHADRMLKQGVAPVMIVRPDGLRHK